jgi:SAM-dependent methyltransferase
MPERPTRPHSAEWFGPERDYWWNRDYLELVATRFGLDAVRRVLDVSCGVGHWGRLIGSILAPEAKITGVDREPSWIRQAAQAAKRDQLEGRLHYQQASAEALPFADAQFDMVTCQTLLIHVASPPAVIREMMRVTAPGGLIMLAEPNNRAGLLVSSSVTASTPIEERLELLRFMLTCERGKEALGEGNNSVGDLVPGYLADAGLEDVQTFVADKSAALFPPYRSAEQQVRRAEILSRSDEQLWGWSREELRRHFTAGGGSDDAFDIGWERNLDEQRAEASALRAGCFHTAGGNMHYLIAGRKRQ